MSCHLTEYPTHLVTFDDLFVHQDLDDLAHILLMLPEYPLRKIVGLIEQLAHTVGNALVMLSGR